MIKNANEYSFFILVGICLVGISGCQPSPEPIKTQSSHPLPSSPVPIATSTPKPLLADSVRLTGSLKAVQEVTIAPRQDAQRIAQVLVHESDTVSPGQILLRLDDRDAAASARAATANVAVAQATVTQAIATYHQQTATTKSNIASAEAGLNVAKENFSQLISGNRPQETAQLDAQVRIATTNLQKAETDLARYQRLLEKGAVARIEVEQYQATRDVTAEQLRAAQEALSLSRAGARTQEIARARAEVVQATETLQQARATLAQNEVRRAEVAAARATLTERINQQTIARQAVADTVLRASIAGRISLRDAEPGQIVGTANTVFHIVSPDVRFEAQVPETDLRYLSLRKQIPVRVDAFPDRVFSGRITAIAPTGQVQGRSFVVRIALADPHHELRPGMFAHTEITMEEGR